MTLEKKQKKVNMKTEGETLEQVTEFLYHGGLITEDGRRTKHKTQNSLASAMLGIIIKIWRSNHNITTATNVKLYIR